MSAGFVCQIELFLIPKSSPKPFNAKHMHWTTEKVAHQISTNTLAACRFLDIWLSQTQPRFCALTMLLTSTSHFHKPLESSWHYFMTFKTQKHAETATLGELSSLLRAPLIWRNCGQQPNSSLEYLELNSLLESHSRLHPPNSWGETLSTQSPCSGFCSSMLKSVWVKHGASQHPSTSLNIPQHPSTSLNIPQHLIATMANLFGCEAN